MAAKWMREQSAYRHDCAVVLNFNNKSVNAFGWSTLTCQRADHTTCIHTGSPQAHNHSQTVTHTGQSGFKQLLIRAVVAQHSFTVHTKITTLIIFKAS